MTATDRVEKHNGFTLVVSDGWVTIVRDDTGHEVGGPVENDEQVRAVAAQAIPFLRGLNLSSV